MKCQVICYKVVCIVWYRGLGLWTLVQSLGPLVQYTVKQASKKFLKKIEIVSIDIRSITASNLWGEFGYHSYDDIQNVDLAGSSDQVNT